MPVLGPRPLRRWPMAGACAIVAGLLLVPAAVAGPTVYLLSDESALFEGCQEGCMCPILRRELAGGLVLTPLSPAGDVARFDVTDVQWVAGDPSSGGKVMIRGSGSFCIRRSPEPAQRLELDLVIGNEPPVRFDSGLVPVRVEFPTLEIAVAMNHFYCYDLVFAIAASPEEYAPAGDSTWGQLKARYGM